MSHQTIYRAIVILPRGELKRDLIPCLRRDGRPDRKAGVPSVSRRPWIERLVTERPAEADDRLTVGHWEGDLIIGQAKSSQAVGVLYERTTRRIRLCQRERHDALTTYKSSARITRRPGGVLPDPDLRSGQRKGGTSAADSGPRDSGVLLPST